jgi:hypothetical protein
MQTFWEICLRYWPDLAIAAVLGVVIDLLRVGSRVREGWRWVKDKYAESSVAAINRRIAEQEKYRNTLQSYLASDKAFYLAMLQAIVGMLLFMCMAGLLLIVGRLRFIVFPGSEIMAFAVLAIAIAAGVSTMKMGSFDGAKMRALIQKINSEIAALNEARQKLLNRK